MKNFFHKYRLYVSIAAYLLAVALVSIFGIQALLNIINDNANAYQKKLVDEESRKKRLGDIPRLRGQYEMVEQEGEKLDLLLEKDSTIDLIKRIEEIGGQTENSVKIQIDEKASYFGTEEEKKARKKDNKNKDDFLLDRFAEFKYLYFKLEIKGKYDNIAGFIKKIENIEYHSDILSISLKKVEIPEKANSPSNPFGGVPLPGSDVPAEKPIDHDLLDGNLDVIFYLK